jgi:hypothetical protein
VSRGPREDIGMRRPGEGAPSDGLHRPGVDEAEGAETQGGPRSQCDPHRFAALPSSTPHFAQSVGDGPSRDRGPCLHLLPAAAIS